MASRCRCTRFTFTTGWWWNLQCRRRRKVRRKWRRLWKRFWRKLEIPMRMTLLLLLIIIIIIIISDDASTYGMQLTIRGRISFDWISSASEARLAAPWPGTLLLSLWRSELLPASPRVMKERGFWTCTVSIQEELSTEWVALNAGQPFCQKKKIFFPSTM